MGKIDVVGLGPGRAGLITRETWELMKNAENLILRTRVHPTVSALDKAGFSYSTYDDKYENAANFAELYKEIAVNLLSKAKDKDIVYAVPGSPLVAERTVVLLRELSKEANIKVTIHPSMSFVEVMYTSLAIDPVDGLTIIDAEDVESLKTKPAQSLIITQVYNQQIASDTKLMLMELFADEQPITYIHNLAMPDEKIIDIPLYELDRQKDIDHLTSLFIRAVK